MHNILRTVLISLTVILAALPASADLKKFMLIGYVYDREWNSVDSCEVEIYKDDTVKVNFKLLTGNDATKTLSGNQLRALVHSGIGNYRVSLYKEGYAPATTTFRIGSVSENTKYLRTLRMEKELNRTLDEVTVSGTRVKMVMKGDTVVFDAAAFRLGEGSMLDALVRQLPGATISADGVIEVNGRKINELLVNGKDFFKGDPKVALQNLPAYTVKNLKVYDKADDDAYLTHSDANADKLEDEQNLVMDVQLKKEYIKGWMANAEAGYGTRDRYMGRLFGLGYTDKLRISVFGNINNTGNSSMAGDNGQWWERTSENGINRVAMGGIDYSYKNGEETELSGNVNFRHNDIREHELSSITRFYPSGDLYRRGELRRRNKGFTLRTNHDLNFRFKSFSFTIDPSVTWDRNKVRSTDLTATFDKDPIENFRGEAIDSVFFSRTPTLNDFRRQLLTSLQSMSVNNPENFHGRINTWTTIRPASWKGVVRVNLIADMERNSVDTRTLYDQAIGAANTSAADPLKRDTYTTSAVRRNAAQANVQYSRDYTTFGEKRTTKFNWFARGIYDFTYNNSDFDTYSADRLPDPIEPPSLHRPEYLIADLINSPYTRQTTSSPRLQGGISYSNSPTAPGDSTLNPSFNMGLNLGYFHYIEHYDFEKPGITEQHLKRTNDWLLPSMYLGFSSQNKVRSISVSLNYMMSHTAPLFSYLVDNRNSSDPMNVVLGNPDGLRNSLVHNVYFYAGRYSRGKHRTILQFNGGWTVRTSSISMAQTYNPATGVTVSRPENISGNWNTYGYLYFSTQFNDSFSINGSLMANGANSTDYVAVDSKPVRSSVFNTSVNPRASLNYTFKGGSIIGVGFGTTIENQHSEREGFNNRTSYAYNPSLRLLLKLPAQIDLNTQFNPYFRRGYENKEMNTTEYIWNATVSKTFAKSGFTIKLAAYDILGSAKHVYTSVNAQGRTETWRNCLPRYVMLSAIYRFDMKKR